MEEIYNHLRVYFYHKHNMAVSARKADLTDPSDAEAVLAVWSEYCCDPNAGGERPSDYVVANLIGEMTKRGVHCFLGYYDDKPAGVAIAMENFTTFHCKSLLNIHDFGVLRSFRRKGLGQAMLRTIEEWTREQGDRYVKITLECLEKNQPAWDGYIKYGFKPYVLNPELGNAVELQKYL